MIVCGSDREEKGYSLAGIARISRMDFLLADYVDWADVLATGERDDFYLCNLWQRKNRWQEREILRVENNKVGL